jgi:hypothetical protein
VVDGNADGGGIVAGDASGLQNPMSILCPLLENQMGDSIGSYLELSDGEATASTNATVVLDGRAADDRPQLVDGAGSDGSSLCAACQPAGDLLAGLMCRNPMSEKPCLTSNTLSFQGPMAPEKVSPGRSVSGPDVANPCGNLLYQNQSSCSVQVYSSSFHRLISSRIRRGIAHGCGGVAGCA